MTRAEVDGLFLHGGMGVAKQPGQMVHIDVKKVERIPEDGRWCVHGRVSAKVKRFQRQKAKNKRTHIGYFYLHSSVDGNTRLAYTETRDNKSSNGHRFHEQRRRLLRRAAVSSSVPNSTNLVPVSSADTQCTRTLGSPNNTVVF